jgi:predicted RNase H-like nuclease (RuvC/YqgF family)
MKKKIFSLYLLSSSILFADTCKEGNCSDNNYFEKLKSNIVQAGDVFQNYEKYKLLERQVKELEKENKNLKSELEYQKNTLNNFSNKAFR